MALHFGLIVFIFPKQTSNCNMNFYEKQSYAEAHNPLIQSSLQIIG